MSDKVDLLKYRNVKVLMEYKVMLNSDDEVVVLQHHAPVEITNLSGINVYDLPSDIVFEEVIHDHLNRKGSMAPMPKLEGIKRGVKTIFSALSGRNKSKIK